MSDFVLPGFVSAQPARGYAGKRNKVASLRIALRTFLTRRALPELTSRELADIGISAAEAVSEAARLPWDIGPSTARAGGVMAAVRRMWEGARARRLLVRRAAL